MLEIVQIRFESKILRNREDRCQIRPKMAPCPCMGTPVRGRTGPGKQVFVVLDQEEKPGKPGKR